MISLIIQHGGGEDGSKTLLHPPWVEEEEEEEQQYIKENSFFPFLREINHINNKVTEAVVRSGSANIIDPRSSSWWINDE